MTEPVRWTGVVPGSPERAFRAFTAEMGAWWPTATHSVEPGRVTTVVVDEHVGGTIRERRDDGSEAAWADVTVWDPPHRLGLAWYAGSDRADTSTITDVEVTFRDRGDGSTEVVLVHTGWERLGDRAAEQRESYETGWPIVAGRYAAHADRPAA